MHLAAAALAAVLLAALAAAADESEDPQQLSGRAGGCYLACRWSSRLCRLCTVAIKLPQKFPAWFPTVTPGTDTTTEESEDDQTPVVVFPDTLPDGSQDAMLETASHILSIVSGEDSESIRTWLENPERNGDNLNRLAGKLSSFPRAPYGRAYWVLVLRSSRDRPFTLLREALALRAAYQLSGGNTGNNGNNNNNNNGNGNNNNGNKNNSDGSTTPKESAEGGTTPGAGEASTAAEASSEMAARV